jgi:hypothetical protein
MKVDFKVGSALIIFLIGECITTIDLDLHMMSKWWVKGKRNERDTSSYPTNFLRPPYKVVANFIATVCGQNDAMQF